MTCPNCKNYDSCDAPLCPRDEQSVRDGCWFPDEAVCPMRRNVPDWVRTQRRLQNLSWAVGYFTVRMLEAIRHPSKIQVGADPGRHVAAAVGAWFRAFRGGHLRRAGASKRGDNSAPIGSQMAAIRGVQEGPEAALAQESKEVA